MKNNCIEKIGVFGGGQLGRMLAQAALPLNLTCVFFETHQDCPAAALGAVFDATQGAELQQFIQSSDVYTLEFENTPLAYAEALAAANKALYPPRNALATAQNRLAEKALFDQLDIPVSKYRNVESEADLHHAVADLGLPLVLKTAMGGYDGKGQFVLRQVEQISEAWHALGAAQILIAETFVPFDREVSIIAVRGQNGEIRTWPLAENHHHHGILSHSIVPAPDSAALQPIAQEYITRLLEHLNYVGVLTLELFVTAKGLLANEMAPRVHNSGHWSIEGAVCSQFENHMRAVAGLPLGSTELISPCMMVNIIGRHPKLEDVLKLSGAHLHFYGKEERVGRKLGHVTLIPTQGNTLQQLSAALAKILPEPLALQG